METPVRNNRILICLILCILVAGQTRAQVKPKIENRAFNLKCLSTALSGQVRPSFNLPLRSSIGRDSGDEQEQQLVGMSLENREFSMDSVVDLLRQVCVQGEDEEEALEWDLQERTLVVRALPKTMRKIESTLVFLERLVNRNAEVEVIALEGRALDDSPAGLLSKEQISKLLAKYPASERLRGLVNLGQSVRLNASRRRQYVADYDVEVAEKSSISDPVVTALVEGMEIGLFVEECLDGRFMMRATGRQCQRKGKARVIRKPAEGLGAIELPRTRSSVFAMSAILTPGSGFLIGSQEARAKSWLVRLIKVDPAPQFGGLKVLETRSLNRSPFLPRIGGVVGPTGTGERNVEESDESEGDETILSTDFLQDSIHRILESQEHENFSSLVTEIDGKLFLRVPANTLARIRRESVAVAAPLVRNVSTEFRYDLVSNESLDALLKRSNSEIATQLGRNAKTFCRTGSRALVSSGEEWLAIKDKNVEIASSSKIADPVMESLFAGMLLYSQPSISFSGDVMMAVDFTFQVDTKKGRVFETGLESIGAIDANDLAHTTGHARYKARNKEWILIRVAPIRSTGKTLVLMTRSSF